MDGTAGIERPRETPRASGERALRPHSVLLSFHYFRGEDVGALHRKWNAKFPTRIFADSGAFSAASLGKPIRVEEYGEWLSANKHLFEVYANLDVIKDPEGSERNQKALERMGHAPMPVFHTGSDMRHLERLIDAGYQYIALGGAVGYRSAVLGPWLVRCFKLAQRKGKGTVFHGFGMTSVRLIKAFPWRSVDSSSWGSGYRFGQLQLFDEARGDFVKVVLFTDDVVRHEAMIRRFGGDPANFLDRKNYHHTQAAAVSALSWRALENWCSRRHRNKGFGIYHAWSGSDKSVRAGPILDNLFNLYMADGSQHLHTAAVEAVGAHFDKRK